MIDGFDKIQYPRLNGFKPAERAIFFLGASNDV